MNFRRQVTFCREGWYFLFVLAFIVGGAVLREVNLLLVLSAMMISQLIFSWRLSMALINHIDVRRNLPRLVHVNDEATVEMTVCNKRRWLPSWALIVRERYRPGPLPSANAVATPILTPADSPANTAPARDTKSTDDVVDVFVPYVPANDQATAAYRLSVQRRGYYHFDRLHVSTRFPFGFLMASVELPCPGELAVAPRLGQLTRNAVRVLGGMRWGQQPAHQRRGLMEAEYYGLREWRPGDSRRWIHWRSSAKTGGLAVLQFEDQQRDDLTLIADLWQPAKALLQEREGVELALSVVATIVARECQTGRRSLAVAVAGEVSSSWHGAASRRLRNETMERLAGVQASAAPRLHEVVQQLGEATIGGMTVVLSTRSAASAQEALRAHPEWDRYVVTRQLLWLNVTEPGLDQFFQWTTDEQR